MGFSLQCRLVSICYILLQNINNKKIEKSSGEHYFCVFRARLVKQREDIRRLKLSKEQLELFRSRLISLFKPNDLVLQFLG
jgi:hypothetical protein